MEAFESWLLHRIAQAVEADEVSVDLLTELQAEFEVALDRPQEQSHADAVQDIAIRLAMPVQKVEAGLVGLETQPRVIREAFVRRGRCQVQQDVNLRETSPREKPEISAETSPARVTGRPPRRDIMAVYKQGSRWWIKYKHEGKTERESTGRCPIA